MSQWTQVAGSIRIDAVLMNEEEREDEKIKEDIEKCFGTVVKWESEQDVWKLPKEERTPTGSEGGLNYKYLTTEKDISCISRGAILIDGALRDYGEDDYKDIQKWLNKAVDKSNGKWWVRQGVIEIDIEYGKTVILLWNRTEEIFEEHTP